MVTEGGEIYTQARTQEMWKEYSGVTCEKIRTLRVACISSASRDPYSNVGCDLYHIYSVTLSLYKIRKSFITFLSLKC